MKSKVTKTSCFVAGMILRLFMFFSPAAAIAATAEQDFAVIQDRLLKSSSDSWAEKAFAGLTLVDGDLDVTQIPSQALVDSALLNFNTSTGLYSDLNYKTSNSGDYIIRMNHFRRLIILALAYRNRPSGYTQTDRVISAAIIQGLSAWVGFFPPNQILGTVFKDGITVYPGFYPNGYGAVVLLVPELVNANADLWSKSIAYLTQYYLTHNTFGANSQAPYRAALIGHVLNKNTTMAAELSKDFLNRELSFSNRENDFYSWSSANITAKIDYSKLEGFQPDYSFGQHTGTGRGNYWGHYGAGFVANMADLMRLTAGTFCSLESGIPFLTDAIVEGMQWSYYTYKTLDLQANGRFYNGGSSRYAWLNSTPSGGYFSELARLAKGAGYPESEAKLITVRNRIVDQTTPTTLRGDRMFWRADFHVHYGDNWRTSVRMSSTRTVSCESGVTEGLYNHYSGSGALYLLQTGLEYKCVSGEVPSANWNWRRLPGITAEQYPDKATLPRHVWGEGGNGGTTFAGGASDGTYGAVGYKHYLADGAGSQPVTAYKAVFVFDKKYVMAGAGISETGGTYPVVTTINQTKLLTTNTGGNAISYFASGVQTDVPLSNSTKPTLFSSGNAWVLSGNTGYVFPVAGGTYSFQQSYTTGTVPPTKDDLFWLGIDHGLNPKNGTYWCVVHPNTTSTALREYLADPDVEVAANTPQMQGAFGPKQVFQGIYYTAGTMSGTSWLRTVKVDQACALILRPDSVATPTKLILTLSNPQCESAHIPAVTVTLRTTYKLAGALDNFDGTYTLTKSVALPAAPGYKGKSVSTDLLIAPISAPVTTRVVAPVITSALNVTATQGQSFIYQITGSESPTGFSAVGLPAWLSLNTATGLISGAPTSVAGTFTFTIGVTNAGGAGSAILNITVVPAAPVITSSKAVTLTNGQPFSYQITGSNSPTGYSATGLLPGLSVNPVTGLISGTPTSVAGIFTSTIGANNAGGSGSAVLTFTVRVPISELESRPPLLSIAGGKSELRVENSVIGHLYQLQRTRELSPNTVWENIGTPQPGSNGVLILSDASGMTGSKVFYRLQITEAAP